MGVADYFKNKVVVITGASSGIGSDLAEYLGGFGAHLALVARRADKLTELAGRCATAGADTLVLPADVCSRSEMEGVRDAVIGKWGRADIVIGNAGIGGLNPADRFDLDIHRQTVEVNVLGLAYTVIPFIPSMLERGSGQLVGVSSLAGFRGLPKAASYSSTKSAQAVFMESLRVDLKPRGIFCSSIHPGFVTTPMTDHDDFPMPFTISVRKSSELISRALMRRKSVYLYPWQMRLATWFNRRLPNWLFDWMMPRVAGHKEDAGPKTL